MSAEEGARNVFVILAAVQSSQLRRRGAKGQCGKTFSATWQELREIFLSLQLVFPMAGWGVAACACCLSGMVFPADYNIYMTFQELELKDEILQAVKALGFETPTPVQERVIPFMLHEQKDLVALAQTGTGKTAAFGLPLLNMLEPGRRQTQALVLSPTRELCIQICKDLRNYAAGLPDIHIVPVYGGEDIRVQLRQLDRTPHIVVATPGRLIDLLQRGKVHLDAVEYLVLDEADEMLNMGFKDDIETILQEVPAEHRTLLFSATMPNEIARIARTYMQNHEEITVGERNSGTENVQHVYYLCQAKQRYLVLKRIVDMHPDIYAIIFCRTRQETKEVAEKLMHDGYNADALHGDLSQAQRDTVMQKFRIHNLQMLVATDVAARGLDVSDLTHVINYNLPDDVEVYTHRSGRTGRANKKGVSVSIIHSKEKYKIKTIERMLKRDFERQLIPSGLDVCKKQLFNMINKMQHVEVNEQIDAYLPQIMKQLEYLSKEDIIKRFVSEEFNRFLDYYKDAPDLNVEEKPADRKSRKRPQDNEAGKPAGKKEPRAKKKKTGEKIRMKINLGERQGITPKRLLGMINDVVGDRDIMVGDIEITNKFTFFDIFADQFAKLAHAFASQNDIELEPAKGSRAYDNRRKADFNEGFWDDGAWDAAPRGRRKGGSRRVEDKPWRRNRRK